MELILREDVAGLGIIGEIVKVKAGYGRNYLLPRGLAVVADRRNLKQLEHHKRVIALKKSRDRGTHERTAGAMQGTVLEVETRAGKGGKLFGSVTNMDLQKLLKEKDFDVDRRHIELKDPIKEIGEYEVRVRVGQDIRATVKVVVSPLGGQLEDKSVDGDDYAPETPVAPEAAATGDAQQAGDAQADDPTPPDSDPTTAQADADKSA